MFTDFKRVILPAILFAATLLFGPARPTATAQPASAWYDEGYSATDAGGSWRFVTDAGDDLIAAGLTFIRVINADCAVSPDQAIVYEGRLRSTSAGDRSWDGQLTPVGASALALPPLPAGSGQVIFVPGPSGTRIDTGLDGVPTGTTFSVCLRRP